MEYPYIALGAVDHPQGHPPHHPGTQALDLLAPQVPRAQINGGIGWDDVRDPTKTISVLVSPYFGALAGDQINLYWGDPNQVVAHYTIENPDVGSYVMQVPVADIQRVGEGTVMLFYKVISGLTGASETSPTTAVIVKLTIPGGPDADPSTPYLNERLGPPQVPFELVGETEATAGFDVTIPAWPNMSSDDWLELSWGTQRIVATPPLTVGQPVKIRITRAIILAGGDGDGQVVRYQVRDRVRNWSLWSPEAKVDVDVGVDNLPAPLLVDAPAGVLDLDVLAGKDATILVFAYPGMAANDRVELTWAGRTFDGNTVDDVQEQIVAAGGGFLTFRVPNDVIAAIAQGHAVIRYHVYPAGGGAARPSKHVSVTVRGAIRPMLAKPVVREASGGNLDPDAGGTQGVTVEIAPWTGMSPGDEVFLWWVGTTSGGSTVLYRDSIPVTGGGVGQPVTFLVPPEEVSVLSGGMLELYYFVQPVDGGLMESPHDLLLVTGAAALAAPTVDFAVGDNLDPAAVPSTGTTVRVRPYTGMAAGDVIHLYWDGQSSASSFSDFFPIGSSWGQREVPFRLAKRYVTDNLNTTVQAHYTVTTAGSLRPSRRQPLKVGVITADRPAPSIRQASGTTLDPVAAQASLTAVVNYPDIQVNDQISVTWTGAPGTPAEGSHTTAAVPVTTVGPQDIALPTTVVAFALGRAVTVSYTVTRGGVTQPSEQLTLMVGTMPAAALPRPVIVQAGPDEIQVGNLTGDPDLTVARWPLIAAGQRVWLRLRGTNINGSAYTRDILIASPLTGGEAAAGIAQVISRTELQGLRDASTLDIEFKVSFDHSGTESQAVTFPLKSYRINAAQVAAPVITLVRDGAGVTIPNDGTTFSTSITLSGTAAANQQVELFDGATSLAVLTVDSGGAWTRVIPSLAAGAHSYTVKALYGAQPTSAPHRLTAIAQVTPVIAAIKDGAGTTIVNGGTTFATTVILSGTANASQQVEIFDGATSLGAVTVDAGGNWTRTVTGLTAGAHSYTARALYGTLPVSAAYSINAVAEVAPVIEAIKDSAGTTIPNGASTFFTTITLSGTANANQVVEIFDGATSLGTANVNTSGAWSLTINSLAAGVHSYTAKARYGTQPTSAVYRITAIAATTPVITLIQDSAGTTIVNGGSTLFTSVTLVGTAAANQQVEIFDGATSLGTITVDSSGNWTRTVTSLAAGAHSYTAKARYGATPVSAAYGITAIAAATPVITAIKDSAGTTIANGGSTFFTTVTLSGTANANQVVEVFDGVNSRGTVNVNASGAWTLTINNLAAGVRSYTAKALYGAQPVSAVYSITAIAATAPVITAIRDSAGATIPHNSTTFSVSATLSGTAAANQQIEIFDGATSLGNVTVDGSGNWTRTVASLAAGAHNYAAKARYGAQPVSATYTITAIAAVTPVITVIKDGAGTTIANGSSTVSTTVTLSGTALANQQVEIFDGATSLGTLTVDSSGNWTRTITGLAAGAHSYTAKAKYGPNPTSTVYTITAVVAVAPVISIIRDNAGVTIPNGGATLSTTVTLSGTASALQQVEIFHNGNSLGTNTVDAGGNWTRTVTGLAAGTNNYQAQARYGSNPVSAVYTITAVATVTPVITAIKDSAGTTIANGSSTVATSVTLSGTASAYQSVEIFDGATSRGTVTVDSSGNWTLALTGLSMGAHSYTARAKYASQPVSAAYNITIALPVAPVIVKARDGAGNAIDDYGGTTSTSITLSGTASANQIVEIFDRSTSLGTVVVDAIGNWTRTIAGLTGGSHIYTAKAKYGSEPVSNAYTITVFSYGNPATYRIEEGNYNPIRVIPNGGSTIYPTARIYYYGNPGQQMDVYYNNSIFFTTTLPADGFEWKFINLNIGSNSYKLKMKGSSSFSETYTVIRT